MKKYQNFKNQRKTCPHNIVRKLHAKFWGAGACGCRDMMYRRKYREKNYGEKNNREKNDREKNDWEKNDREKNYGEKNGREIPILIKQ